MRAFSIKQGIGHDIYNILIFFPLFLSRAALNFCEVALVLYGPICIDVF
jgi:hypothetical protein